MPPKKKAAAKKAKVEEKGAEERKVEETKAADEPAKAAEEASPEVENKADEVKADAPKEAAEAPKDEAKEEPKDVVKEEEPKDVVKEDKDDVKEEKGAEDAEMKDEAAEEEKEPEGPVFTEETDAADDKRPKLKADAVAVDMTSATPNAMLSDDGGVLMTLCEGGCQYLLAGVKSSIGVKSGRYMFEVKIVEMLSQYEGNNRGARTPAPKQLLRIGLSTAEAGSILAEDADQVYFDSDGNFVHKEQKNRVARQFQWGNVIAVVINVDESSPHKNTISLFRDGQRLCDPQAIPEGLVGKALFPTLTYRNLTLQLNFGPHPKIALPFKCRMIKDAAKADVAVTAERPAGKSEVLFPVGLPDQGIFDWLDQFLEKNPKHLELSDRKVLEWARESGFQKQRGYDKSNDKPGMNFGVAAMDDFSVQKAMLAVAPTLQKDLVCMELNANLQAAERSRALKRFPNSDFKRVAVVAMGEPPKEYKERIQKMILDEKIDEAEKAKKKAEEDKRWQEYQDQTRKRKAPAEEKKDDEEKDGEEKEGDNKEEVTEEKKEEEPEEKPVELTEEEKAINFRKMPSSDIEKATLTRCYANYSIPSKEEGFDEVRYVWSPEKVVAEKFREWVLENKRTTRIEDLEPSAWFKEKLAAWEKAVAEWTKAQNEKKDVKKDEPAKPKKEGDDDNEAKDEEADDKKEEKKDEEFDEDEVDVFALENINDIGNGKSVFANFVYEDWTLLGVRYNLHLLVHAFKHDVDDEDRPTFHESHLDFYYRKYFGKSLNLGDYAVESFADLAALIKDAVQLNEKTKFVEAVLPADAPLDKFLRYTEEHRRERQRCVDAGDETALLKFPKPQPQRPSGGYQGGGHRAGGSGGYQQRTSGGQREQWADNRGGGNRSGGYGDRGSYNQSGGSQRGSYPSGGDRGGDQQKRSYDQRSSTSYPPQKQARSDYGSSSQGSYGGRGGSSYGGGSAGYGGSRGGDSRSGGNSYGRR